MESFVSNRPNSFDVEDSDEEGCVKGSGDHLCSRMSQRKGDNKEDFEYLADANVCEESFNNGRLDTGKSCKSTGSRNGLSADEELSPKERETLCSWIGDIPLSKPVKHFQRDFSDGVLLAEVIAHFFPKLIELHSYVGANSSKLKRKNWELLNRKALPKLGMKLKDSVIESICQAKVGYIERVLERVRQLIKKGLEDEAKAYLRGAGDGETDSLVPETCYVHRSSLDDSDCPPDYVVFRAKKYIHESHLDEKEGLIGELTDKNKELSSKVRRLDTLLQLKENSLQEMTQELYQLKMNYNRALHDGDQVDDGRVFNKRFN